MTDFQACYVCEKPVRLSEPDPKYGGAIKELDENGHAFCEVCFKQIQALYQEVLEWSSSEDHDLLVDNAIAIGLRAGRQAKP